MAGHSESGDHDGRSLGGPVLGHDERLDVSRGDSVELDDCEVMLVLVLAPGWIVVGMNARRAEQKHAGRPWQVRVGPKPHERSVPALVPSHEIFGAEAVSGGENRVAGDERAGAIRAERLVVRGVGDVHIDHAEQVAWARGGRVCDGVSGDPHVCLAVVDRTAAQCQSQNDPAPAPVSSPARFAHPFLRSVLADERLPSSRHAIRNLARCCSDNANDTSCARKPRARPVRPTWDSPHGHARSGSGSNVRTDA